jgi:predicted DNA-binding protein (MmcQ/YjbR family)
VKTSSAAALKKIRAICLAFPDAWEKEAWGEPTFRVGERMFAVFSNDHHGDGRVAIVCKAPPGMQDDAVRGDPERYYVPPYVGGKGWLGMRLDRGLDWKIVASVLRQAYAETAAGARKTARPRRPTARTRPPKDL